MPNALTSGLLSARVGKWWFKNRSLSPVPLFLLIVFLPGNFVPSFEVFSLALAGAVVAEAIRLWAVGYAGSATRTRGDTVPELVTSGPYRFVRNPLYIANILLYTSCSVLFGFTFLTVFVFFYSCVQYSFIVSYEEDLLARSFGSQYRYYAEGTPRWFAFTRALYPPSGHTFSLMRSIRSERSTLLLIVVMCVALWIKRMF